MLIHDLTTTIFSPYPVGQIKKINRLHIGAGAQFAHTWSGWGFGVGVLCATCVICWNNLKQIQLKIGGSIIKVNPPFVTSQTTNGLRLFC